MFMKVAISIRTESVNGDATKLLSLLALAAGAVAIPETSNADIIFTDLSANPVTVGTNANSSFLIDNLPGTARLGFLENPKGLPRQSIVASQQAGYVRLKTASSFLVKVDAGVTW